MSEEDTKKLNETNLLLDKTERLFRVAFGLIILAAIINLTAIGIKLWRLWNE